MNAGAAADAVPLPKLSGEVSGRLPEPYWPDCVPCAAAPAVGLVRNGYQDPQTSP